MIDFHCHLDLFPDPAGLVKECEKRSLYVLSVTTTPSAFTGTRKLSSGSARIRTALGLHPQLARERKYELPLFDQLLPKTRYVGEVGLDGTPELKASWGDQLEVFEHVLRSCQGAGGKVLSIHSRRAARQVLDCLAARPGAGAFVLHWFSGSMAELKRAVALECWFSVGPAMLSSDKGRALVKAMPPERIITESDGPFAQMDGTPIMPWQAEDTKALAALWSIPEDAVGKRLLDNLKALVRERLEAPRTSDQFSMSR